MNLKKKESERIAAEEEAKRKAAEALAEKQKDREQIREETEEMITTETSPMKKNISENTKNITLNTENISQNANKIGIISTNYDALSKIVQQQIDDNATDHKEFGLKISGNYDELSDSIKLINDSIASVRAPYVTNTTQDASNWLTGSGKDIAVEGQLLLARDANEIDQWVADENGTKIAKPIHGALVPKDVIDTVYPVGSVIVRFDLRNTEDLFPGTKWKPIDGNYVLTTNPGNTRSDSAQEWDPEYVEGDLNNDVPMTLTIDQIPSHTHSVGKYTIEGAEHSHSVSEKGITITMSEPTNNLTHFHTFKGADNGGVIVTTTLSGNHSHTYSFPTRREKHGYHNRTPQSVLDADWTDRPVSDGGEHKHDINLSGVQTDNATIEHKHSITAIQGSTDKATPKLTLTGTSEKSGSGKEHSHQLQLPKIYCTLWVRYE